MDACVAEKTSFHHGKDQGAGHFPVLDVEYLVIAVRPDTALDAQGRLDDRSRLTTWLRKCELSVCRVLHSTIDDFTEIVCKGERVIFVLLSTAGRLRFLDFETAEGVKPRVAGRSVCVVDKVRPEEHDSHATIGFSEPAESLTTNQKNGVRAVIVSQIVEAFGARRSVDATPWLNRV